MSELARLNRELVEHRRFAGAGLAMVAYSLALFAFGLAANGAMFTLGIVMISLAATLFMFGLGAALLHAAAAARAGRQIRRLTRLPAARVIRAPARVIQR